ncbi:MAG: type II toxin-antitoxin system prevent-host-death family antitoxin [Solirubrobacterales bacterium]|nr:type II toxin-antitoxin system prevent-host-death family antitoxin [Solirubrobacterales bacterium]
MGIAEFKAKLSKYIERAQQGEEVVVTDRGRPVVTVNQIPDLSSEIEELVRAGIVTPPKGTLPDDFFTRERPPEIEGPGLSDAVIEERREARY